ncbi:TetR/AcrR family transcriptional regulator [Lactococcus garvieae]|uniref:TetR/AcrR family transcriptional regulator n=1 Tax=Lactococcus garvieae TaxID=1363 RepID=UPI0018D856E4|nr:TetR/AcrR family transcriptional regulator [Lactococcus garvieae]QPS71781.1 TetR/AcrR family transcriptional regulator [Lactococcus garvieae]
MSEAKDKIIESSKKLFCQRGYASTSIRDILEDSGTGKGQLYHYFLSKKEICLEVIRSHMHDWEIQVHQDETRHYGCAVGNLVVELGASEDKDFRELLGQLMETWTDLIEARIIEITNWNQEQARIQAQHIISTIQGSLLLLKLTQDWSVFKNSLDNLGKEVKALA